MNTQIIKNAISAAIALTIAGCGGSGGGISGIGGSGFISTGSVSNFGSVFVNGVEFETNGASFDIDGSVGSQSDLGIGMIVQVDGTINADGVTGNAREIRFDDQLQGPVSALSVPDADGVKRTFTVMGVTVIIDSGSTTFDISGENGIPPGTPFDFDVIADNNNVEISGFLDSSGKLIATRVELKDIAFDPASIVEVHGTITGLVNTSFGLEGSTLNINAASAVIDDLPNGLEDGRLVEVKGTYDSGSNTITATKVEGENNTITDRDEFEAEGIITNYISDSNFVINGLTVDAGGAGVVREPSTLMLANDVRIEAEGAIVNGILVATKVELRGGNAKIHAQIGLVDVAGSTFEAIPVAGEPAITVTVTSSTQLEDDVNNISAFSLSDLVPNTDFVEIRGFEDGVSSVTATEVEVDDPDDVIVQGSMSAFTADSFITVMGVSFQVDYSVGAGETEFENASDVGITQNDFETAAPVGTLVKVKDRDNNGIADEIEIETP